MNDRKTIILIYALCVILFLPYGKIKAASPYIHKVYEYMPAPGQFVNVLPKHEDGDTQEDMNRKAEESISGENKILISLGAYGGYVIFGFDHPIVNVPDSYDFKILGNAFYAHNNPNQHADNSREGGSCEPGIVMVSYDANDNGLPDDAWYELAGSEYYKTETTKNYELSYYQPDENKVREPMPDYPFINDVSYVKWTSNQGDEGYVHRNSFHNQPYYPQWIAAEKMVFEGTKLADNYVDESGTGSYYVQYAYDWGYADNHPNTDERSNFNIAWAVDDVGNSVHLPEIHFVKVYTGVNQYCGWLGETSTEIMGAEDLHPDAVAPTGIFQNQIEKSFLLLNNPVENTLKISSAKQQNLEVYDYAGRKQMSLTVKSGTHDIPCHHLPKGVYILVGNNHNIKFIKQ